MLNRSPRAGRALLAAATAAALLLAGCATLTTPVGAVPDALYTDSGFQPPSAPIDARQVMAVTPEMREFLKRQNPSGVYSAAARDRLLDDLFTRGRLKLDYEASSTRTAAQAFEARRGNCLSLVLLTAALAREMDLAVTFQSVSTDEVWSRAGDMYFLSGHVNVVLGRRMAMVSEHLDRAVQKVVDFLPAEDVAGMHTRAIGENTVLAMFMNNRAAESLVAGQVDDAYWYAREAIRQDPNFLSSYNTLGVVYLRHKEPARAEQVLRFVAAHDPDNPRMVGNLAQSLRDQGRVDEARILDARLEQIEPYPPFHFFVLGQLAMVKGDYAGARAQFQRELRREPDYHEFHFWLAQADVRLGDYEDARKHLALAMENSTKRSDKDLYAAKLDRMSAAGFR